MTQKPDNPLAFPMIETDTTHGSPGMTLRDYFAAAALTGLCAGHPEHVNATESTAVMAYLHADAMLKARQS